MASYSADGGGRRLYGPEGEIRELPVYKVSDVATLRLN
jgi:hypothetical protein